MPRNFETEIKKVFVAAETELVFALELNIKTNKIHEILIWRFEDFLWLYSPNTASLLYLTELNNIPSVQRS